MNAAAQPGSSRVLVNVVLYQAGWFLCVLSAARDRPGWGIALAVSVVCGWLAVAPRPAALLQLSLLTAVVGYSWDSWLSVLGLIRYSAGPLNPPLAALAPLWILALWLLFSSTLHVALRWLQSRLRLAAVLGALAAPLAYYGAARFGALTLPRLLPALGAQAAGWALLLPLLLCLARRLNA